MYDNYNKKPANKSKSIDNLSTTFKFKISKIYIPCKRTSLNNINYNKAYNTFQDLKNNKNNNNSSYKIDYKLFSIKNIRNSLYKYNNIEKTVDSNNKNKSSKNNILYNCLIKARKPNNYFYSNNLYNCNIANNASKQKLSELINLKKKQYLLDTLRTFTPKLIKHNSDEYPPINSIKDNIIKNINTERLYSSDLESNNNLKFKLEKEENDIDNKNNCDINKLEDNNNSEQKPLLSNAIEYNTNAVNKQNNIKFDLSIPIYLNENEPVNSLEREYYRYAFYSNSSRKLLLKRIMKFLFLIDILVVLISIFVAVLLYFDHFDYITTEFQISDNSNKIRIFGLFCSFIQIVLIIIRNNNIRSREILKYYLNYIQIPSRKKVYTRNLVFEIIIHLLQPYPYIQFRFSIAVLGNIIYYSLNMLLFMLYIVRFYYIYNIFNKWITFSSERAKRIQKFLLNENSFIIIVKSILKYYGLLSNFALFLFFTYLFALGFKVLEHFHPELNSVNFSEIVNCLWYIIVTMTCSKIFYLINIKYKSIYFTYL